MAVFRTFFKSEDVPQKITAGVAIFAIMRNLTAIFPPEFVTATGDRANVGYVGEILSLFAFIFSSGPVKVWLDMQIGTTSIDKIVEDYEEKRSWASQQMGHDDRPDLLPKENKRKPTGPVKR